MITLDITKFKTLFPLLAATPDATITMQWETAHLYISNESFDGRMIYLMTAHLIALSNMLSLGNNPMLISQATNDKESVTLVPPPAKSQFQWWLNTTAYGAQLSALLKLQGTGGMMVGGSPERSAFRKARGVF